MSNPIAMSKKLEWYGPMHNLLSILNDKLTVQERYVLTALSRAMGGETYVPHSKVRESLARMENSHIHAVISRLRKKEIIRGNGEYTFVSDELRMFMANRYGR